MRLADPARSRILLIGTPFHTHTDERLPDVPVVANNLTDLAAVFTDPELGGFDDEHCVQVPIDASLAQIGDALNEAADEAEDLLLIYYSGHGMTDDKGNLYLTLAETRWNRLQFSALRYESVRDVCLSGSSRAASKVVIIDSCFSGRAAGGELAGGGEVGEVLANKLQVFGTYTLTSAHGNSAAVYLPGERHTAFTGRLLDLLRSGDPKAGPTLTLGTIFDRLHHRLLSEGLPAPQRRSTGVTDQLGLVRNRGAVAAELPEDLREALESRRTTLRLAAVDEVAVWLAESDPSRVLAATNALRQVADEDNPTLAAVARAHLAAATPPVGKQPATVDSGSGRPARPPEPKPAVQADERTAADGRVTAQVIQAARAAAEAITDRGPRATALAEVARSVAVVDPVLARQLAGQAIQAVSAVTEREWRAQVLAGIARSLAVVDPVQAMEIAGDIDFRDHKMLAFAGIAQGATGRELASRAASQAVLAAAAIGTSDVKTRALGQAARAIAAADPDQAVAIVDSLDGWDRKVSVLADVVRVVAVADPALATRIATQAVRAAARIGSSDLKAKALGQVAPAIAAGDPARALEIAESIDVADRRVSALADVVRVVAVADPALAIRIATQATLDAAAIGPPSWKAMALGQVAQAIAATDPTRALEIAESIEDPDRKVWAFACVVREVAAVDRVLASRIARQAVKTAAGIDDPDWKARASVLSEVALAVAEADPAQALEIAESIDDPDRKVSVLAEVARAVAAADPAQAMEIAESIEDPYRRVWALVGVALAVASVDPTRALAIVGAIDDPDRKAWALTALVNRILGEADGGRG